MYPRFCYNTNVWNITRDRSTLMLCPNHTYAPASPHASMVRRFTYTGSLPDASIGSVLRVFVWPEQTKML